MKEVVLAVGALCFAGGALAQDAGWSVTVGLRAWNVGWTTFSYIPDPNDPTRDLALTQVSAPTKVVFMPQLSVRHGKFLGSVSMLPTTNNFAFDDTPRDRREIDANLGYSVLPGLTVTLGYKQVWQRKNGEVYRPSGPVLGLSANAPLDGAVSMYGSVGVGRLKTPSGDRIDFEADYRLTELGLAYTFATGSMPLRWTATAGYRMQVLTSKEAFGTQDGQDTTKGLTLGLLATF
jgi:hypothetical protein